MRYMDMKKRHEKEFNEFPIMWAFSDKQFAAGMYKLGLKPKETYKLYSIGSGGYIRKTDSQALTDMLERHDEERTNALQSSDQYAYEAFLYELGNHEYCITYDYEPTLDALGLTLDDVTRDARLLEILKQATRDYIASCKDY